MVSPTVSSTLVSCILIQKHDIRAEDVLGAISDLRTFVEETLVAMPMKKGCASCQRDHHGFRGFSFAIGIEDGLPALYTILGTSEVYE